MFRQNTKNYMNKKITVILTTLLMMLAGQSLASESSPYAGEETREIKALSKSQIAGLLAGKGMGYGKAAELNGYPGPAHVLELQEALALTAEQRKATETIFQQMQAAAKDLGADLVAAEGALDNAFSNKLIDDSSLAELVNTIGDIESRLRAVHLRAHLQQVEILNDQQIAKYMTLRGYGRAKQGHHHEHHPRK